MQCSSLYYDGNTEHEVTATLGVDTELYLRFPKGLESERRTITTSADMNSFNRSTHSTKYSYRGYRQPKPGCGNTVLASE